MPRRIVICCDGTGNEIKQNESNVLKFYRVLKESDDQIGFYDPGVGTISNSGAWARWKNKAKGVFGLATGYGLDGNVLDAYRFLLRHYEDGDQIYLLGFSRGAHTVRVLAGFINMVGLLHPHQEHLASYALAAYKQASTAGFEFAWQVQEVLATRRVTIRFMGCWDTVASVIVPRADRFYLPSLESLPYTHQNPCVHTFRQACAIDERRRMFRLARWLEEIEDDDTGEKSKPKFKTHPFVEDDKADDQDIKQVWFAGVHADIGGGYPEQESGAAKFALGWMVDEAKEHGLEFRERMVKHLVRGQTPSNTREGSKRDYVAPSAVAALHNSMTWAWKPLEYLPKRWKWHDNPEKKKKSGVYFPLKQTRFIPDDAIIHASVLDRHKLDPDYAPPNLPKGWRDNLTPTDPDPAPANAQTEPTSQNT